MGEFNIWYLVIAFVLVGTILPQLLNLVFENFMGILALFVVAVVIALAMILIPAYIDNTIREHVSSGISLASDVKSKVENYYSKNREIPNSNSLIDIEKIPISNEYVSNLSVSNGSTVEIEFGKQAKEQILGKKVIFKANVEKNSLIWSCITNIEEIKYLPENARGICHFSKL